MGQGACATSIAYEASQYPVHKWPIAIAAQITNDARPKIIDAPLKLI